LPDQDRVLALYIDGRQASEILLEDFSVSSLRIGGEVSDLSIIEPYRERWNGLLDDLAVWNRVLSDAELARLVNASGPLSQRLGESGSSGPQLAAAIVFSGDDSLQVEVRWNTTEGMNLEQSPDLNHWTVTPKELIRETPDGKSVAT
jgi:hypothetical protein